MWIVAYLIGHEIDVVSLQSCEGDGVVSSHLWLREFGEDGNGLGKHRVLQSQKVHLDLGLYLCAVWTG